MHQKIFLSCCYFHSMHRKSGVGVNTADFIVCIMGVKTLALRRNL